MKKLIYILFLFSHNLYGQDVHFSQYEENPLLVNPANAGMKNDIRAIANYRSQWKSVNAHFRSMALSYDMVTSKDPSKFAVIGLGVNLFNDQAGDANLSATQGNFTISSILNLDALNKLSIGIQGGFGQRGIDQSKLKWGNQYDGSYNSSINSNENFDNSNFTFFDAAAGIAWSYGKDQSYMTSNDGVKANLGLSYFHFDLPRSTFSSNNNEKLYSRLSFHGNIELGQRNTNLTFIPSFLTSIQQKQFETVFGCDFRYLLQEGSKYTGYVKETALALGIHHRFKDAVIAKLMFQYANYAVGVSYDFNISQLTSVSRAQGGFEISLKFVTPNPFKPGGTSKFR